MSDYKELNRANWDDRVPIHLASEDYAVAEFISDRTRLSDVVRNDRDVFGDVTGKTLVHLQCHIGTDTISWARLGAEATGLDFSPAAIAAARQLSHDCGTPGRFVESDVYEAPTALGGEQFDLVYTGVGALCWLPNIQRWAQAVAAVLKPRGMFYIRDGHPMLFCIDETRTDGVLAVDYDYFEGDPIVCNEETSYVGEGHVANKTTHQFNHGLGETISALIEAGLTIDYVRENNYTEWRTLPQMVQAADGLWRLPERPNRLPMMFAIRAKKV